MIQEGICLKIGVPRNSHGQAWPRFLPHAQSRVMDGCANPRVLNTSHGGSLRTDMNMIWGPCSLDLASVPIVLDQLKSRTRLRCSGKKQHSRLRWFNHSGISGSKPAKKRVSTFLRLERPSFFCWSQARAWVALPGSDELPSSLVHWWFFCWRYQQTIINLISLQTSDLSLASMVYEKKCQITVEDPFWTLCHHHCLDILDPMNMVVWNWPRKVDSRYSRWNAQFYPELLTTAVEFGPWNWSLHNGGFGHCLSFLSTTGHFWNVWSLKRPIPTHSLG